MHLGGGGMHLGAFKVSGHVSKTAAAIGGAFASIVAFAPMGCGFVARAFVRLGTTARLAISSASATAEEAAATATGCCFEGNGRGGDDDDDEERLSGCCRVGDGRGGDVDDDEKRLSGCCREGDGRRGCCGREGNGRGGCCVNFLRLGVNGIEWRIECSFSSSFSSSSSSLSDDGCWASVLLAAGSKCFWAATMAPAENNEIGCSSSSSSSDMAGWPRA
jgi:hypothetical protein